MSLHYVSPLMPEVADAERRWKEEQAKMTDPDEKRLAEIRERMKWTAGNFSHEQDIMLLLRLLDASQARLTQAEHEAERAHEGWDACTWNFQMAESKRKAAEERASALAAALTEVVGCFEAAEAEGLSDCLQTNGALTSGLRGLYDRRIAFAYEAARAALSQAAVTAGDD